MAAEFPQKETNSDINYLGCQIIISSKTKENK